VPSSRGRSPLARRGALATALALILAGMPFGSVVITLSAAARTEDSAAKIEEQYQNENDPVRKAKLLAKLGPLEVDRARAYINNNDDEHALSAIAHYRDEVHKTTDQLDAAKLNVAKHSSGYKELQIGLRESIRRLNDTILSLPEDRRPPFEAVRSDLTAIQAALFEELFPTAAEKSENKRAQQ
jgi:hypothetical protein